MLYLGARGGEGSLGTNFGTHIFHSFGEPIALSINNALSRAIDVKPLALLSSAV